MERRSKVVNEVFAIKAETEKSELCDDVVGADAHIRPLRDNVGYVPNIKHLSFLQANTCEDKF